MKRILVALALTIALAFACSPTATPEVRVVVVTATPEPTAAPTATPQANVTPIPTRMPAATTTPSRVTAFDSTFSDFEAFLTANSLVGTGPETCLLNNVPLWVECDRFGFLFEGVATQMVDVMHDGESVVGLVVMDDSSLAEAHPDEVTIGFGLFDLVSLGMPMHFGLWPERPTREGDFVLMLQRQGQIDVYVYLDPTVAEAIFGR